jgi:peptidoglycan/xylan/chitin deacetylase (PgdA/CDA1 family)
MSWGGRLNGGKREIKRWLGRVADSFGSSRRRDGLRSLMYHSIAPRPIEDPEQMTISVDLFREQMAFLAASGYTIAEAATVLRQWRAGTPPAPDTILLTFDDGFANNFHLAFPILQHYKFPATIFVMPSALDGKVESLRNSWHDEYLTWDQARAMQESGLIQFGCHSATHRRLRGLSSVVLQEETEGAKRRLEDGLGRPVETFAYPYGAYGSWDQAARRAVERAGFIGAFTTVAGVSTTETDRFLLRRSRVSWCDEIPEFRRLLRGAYDWYGVVQLFQRPGFQSADETSSP